MAYTPGLKVKRVSIVRKTRRLPVQGEVLVRIGDVVTPETIIARTEIDGDIYIVDVAKALDLEGRQIEEQLEETMLKKVGDPVEKDELIASKKLFFGLIKNFCYSPTKGTITSISTITGSVTVQEPPIPISVLAYIPGKVVEILPREGVVIETTASFIQGVFGIGGEMVGEMKMISDSPTDILTAEQIGPECSGKIIVGGSFMTIDALYKAEKIGVKGIVVGGMDNEDMTTFLGYEIGVAITGQEEIGLSLILTEGFSRMDMSNQVFGLLKSLEGHRVSINGTTQIRAGVIRPEVIIPLEDVDSTEISEDDSDLLESGMGPGTLVRIIREPFFGAIGHVAELPVELARIETESSVRVAVINLDEERKVTVPRANLEIIEE